MTTPEGRVKNAVKKALIAARIVPYTDVVSGRATAFDGFFYMPVAGAFSVHGVHDFVGCLRGVFFSIETKAPDEREDATRLQAEFYRAVKTSGGLSYVGVRDDSVVTQLQRDTALRIAGVR